MEIKNNIYSSIEQITGQYLNQKTKESTDAAAMPVSYTHLRAHET